MGELVSIPTPAAQLAEALSFVRECRLIQTFMEAFRVEVVFSDDCPLNRWVLSGILRRARIAYNDGEDVSVYAVVEVLSRDERRFELVSRVRELLRDDDERVPPWHIAFMAGSYTQVVTCSPAR